MVADPWIINASSGAPSYDAAELRRIFALPLLYNGRVLGARAGVRPGGTALETSIAGTTITVKAGTACVDPALSSTQGPYWVALPADETHTLTAADATNPRKDITVLRVYDHDEDASGQRKAQSEYVVGTAAPSPSEPAVPSGAFKLATIDVPASGGGSPVVTLNFPYTVASGGILPVRNQTERAALLPYKGMVIDRLDRTNWLERYDGAAWRVLGIAVCSTVTDRDTAITNPYSGQYATITDLDILYQYDGLSASWVAQVPGTVLARCTADTTRNNSTTLLNVTGMSVSLAASSAYTVDGAIAYSSNATADIKFAFSTTGSPTGWFGAFGEYTTGAGTVGDLAAFREVTLTNVQLLGGADGGLGMLCRPGGYVVTTGAATMQLQFAQNVANASDTIVRLGSWLRFTRVS